MCEGGERRGRRGGGAGAADRSAATNAPKPIVTPLICPSPDLPPPLPPPPPFGTPLSRPSLANRRVLVKIRSTSALRSPAETTRPRAFKEPPSDMIPASLTSRANFAADIQSVFPIRPVLSQYCEKTCRSAPVSKSSADAAVATGSAVDATAAGAAPLPTREPEPAPKSACRAATDVPSVGEPSPAIKGGTGPLAAWPGGDPGPVAAGWAVPSSRAVPSGAPRRPWPAEPARLRSPWPLLAGVDRACSWRM